MSEHSEALIALVHAVELLDVKFLEISAALSTDPAEADEDDLNAPIQPEHALGVDIAADQGRFRLRLRMDIDTVLGDVVVVGAAEYQVEDFDPKLLDQPLLIEFANEVGVMTLLPYMRQAIADITQRVFGAPLVMPILPRGTVAFEPVLD